MRWSINFNQFGERYCRQMIPARSRVAEMAIVIVASEGIFNFNFFWVVRVYTNFFCLQLQIFIQKQILEATSYKRGKAGYLGLLETARHLEFSNESLGCLTVLGKLNGRCDPWTKSLNWDIETDCIFTGCESTQHSAISIQPVNCWGLRLTSLIH